MDYFETAVESETRGIDSPYYTLEDIRRHLKINEGNYEGHQRINELVAKDCMMAICNTSDSNFIVVANALIEDVVYLPGLCSKAHERPDIIVYSDGYKRKVIVTGEVRSSPMLWTERKAIRGAANLLRLLRCSNSSLQTITNLLSPI